MITTRLQEDNDVSEGTTYRGKKMSLIKKFGAVALGTGSAVGWLAVNATKVAFEAAADKVGSGSITGKNGQTYSGSDYKDAANKCNDSIFSQGLKMSKKLWNDED